MFYPLIITFLIIAAAELGDKTQLLTLGFAYKYPFWEVIGAVSAATAALMAIAVIFGGALTRLVPEFYIQLFSGIIFIGFGFWTLVGKENKEKAAAKSIKNSFLAICSSFFIAELGDKTQLAAFALSAKYSAPFQVWLGATLGMVVINVIAALAGRWVNKKVSENAVKWIGALTFIVFGVLTLITIF